jgi:hypothetical protein
VCGTAIDYYLTETGSTPRPRDLSSARIEALVLDSAGNFTTHVGVGHADGSYVVPNVPAGTYYLRYDDPDPVEKLFLRFTVTSARNLSLGWVYYGRPDGSVVNTSPSDLVFNVGGMAPWQDGDELQVTTLNGGGFANSALGSDGINPAGQPTAGATTLSGFTVDWSGTSTTNNIDQAMLIDGSRGDELLMAQLVPHAGSVVYSTITKLFRAPSFTMMPGQASTIAGSFMDVPQNQQLSISWQRSQFEALASSIHPNATSSGTGFSVTTYPGSSAYSYIFAVLVGVQTPAGTGDVNLALTYANPYPSTWVVDVQSCMSAQAPLPFPTGGTAMTGVGTICTDISPGSGTSIGPVLSPPQNLTVNGMSATGPLSGVGTTPTIGWSAPAIGTARGCFVAVRQRPPNTAYPNFSISTGGTSVRIPPGVLQPAGTGVAYSFNVGCSDFGSGFAEAFTGAMTP